jgi:TPR repeat protein
MYAISSVTSVVPYNRNQTYQGFLSSRSISSLHPAIPVARISLSAPQQSLSISSLDTLWRRAMCSDPRSQYALARELYLQGNGSCVGKSWAKRWIRQAAEQGHPKAMYDCARMYITQSFSPEVSIEKRSRRAYNFLVAAAKKNLPEAHCALGEIYSMKWIGKFFWVPKNDMIAKECFTLAASRGDLRAMQLLASGTRGGQWGPINEESTRRAVQLFQQTLRSYHSSPNTNKEPPLFAPSYEPFGDLMSLAHCYLYGAGLDYNKAIALEFYRRAANCRQSTSNEKVRIMIMRMALFPHNYE